VLALVAALATALPATDVVSMGETATEALLGLDDSADSGDSMDLGESADPAAAPVEVPEERPPVFLPKPVVEKPTAGDKAHAERQANALVTKLQAIQSEAAEADVKARNAEKQADSLHRLASTKMGFEQDKMKKQAFTYEDHALVLRKKATEMQKKAYEMKLAMKEKANAILEDNEVEYQKAHFQAVKAAAEKAAADTAMAAAKMKKPLSSNPCDITMDKSERLCMDERKRQKAKGVMLESDMAKEEKFCMGQARVVRDKCFEASVKEGGATLQDQHARKFSQKMKGNQHIAAHVAKTLARYKDIETPQEPDGPIGIFSYNELVYLLNKDGTRTWIRYPVNECKSATPNVVPQQFPVSKAKPEFNPEESEIACTYASYVGKGNPDFYKNCDCAGMMNSKGHGGHCEKWGFKFNWCYVVAACGYGNTAYSGEVKGAKVLVGCNIPLPSMPESMP